MAIKTYKPTTPSRRHMTVSAFEGIDKKAKPERSLLENLKKSAGRNSYGRITVRHRGGGNKKKYRIIDLKRDKEGTATVINLQYDPNRSANIALIQYEDGEKRYILAPVGLKSGHIIMTGPEADILPTPALDQQQAAARSALAQALAADGVPQALADRMIPAGFSAEMLRHAVHQRGCYPEDTPIAAYDPQFVQGSLIASWDKWHEYILDNADIPF